MDSSLSESAIDITHTLHTCAAPYSNRHSKLERRKETKNGFVLGNFSLFKPSRAHHAQNLWYSFEVMSLFLYKAELLLYFKNRKQSSAAVPIVTGSKRLFISLVELVLEGPPNERLQESIIEPNYYDSQQ